MAYTISTPKREAALRAEMIRRAKRIPLAVRVRDLIAATRPSVLVILLIACALAASYGDTLSGINPS